MIDTAAQYEMVDMTGLSGYITGDVLPVRAVAADGSEAAMRYEDLLFLQEAFLERAASCDSTIAVASPREQMLDDYEFYPAVSSSGVPVLAQTGRGPVFVDASKSNSFNFVTTTASTIHEALYALGYGFTNDAQPTISGYALGIDDVRTAFYRTKKFTRTLRRVPLGDLFTATRNASNVYSDGTKVDTDPSTGDWDGEIYNTGYATIAGSLNVRYSFSFKGVTAPRWTGVASGATDNVTYSMWLLLMEATHSQRNGNPDTVRKLVTRTGGNQYRTAFNPVNLASQLASACGMAYSASPHYSADDGYSYRALDVALLTTHKFPAEVNSISGWTWQPT